MATLLELRKHQFRDSVEIIKLKKKFNSIATELNSHCQEGSLFSKNKQFELIHDLYLVGKEINQVEQMSTSSKNSLESSS
jgi:hypothetical protein